MLAAATISSDQDAAGPSFYADQRSKLAFFLLMSTEFFILTLKFAQYRA